MRWEDARVLLEAIKGTRYKPTAQEKDAMENAQRHVDQRRDMNKSAELPLHAIYRVAHGGGVYERSQKI
jgi:hypothetical protein